MSGTDHEYLASPSNSTDSNQLNLSKKSCHSSCSDLFFVSTNDRKATLHTATENICPRCNQIVYPFEKIGPIKGHVYHKVCFKCIVCGRQLDLRSYFTNSDDLDDKKIYCQSHFPQSRKGYVDADNFMIRNIMQGPKPSVIQQLNLPKELIAARQQIFQVQKDLELKQKAEEDALYRKFFEERKRHEERIELELDKEWKMNLKELCKKYEDFGNTEEELKQSAPQFQREKQYLQDDLTLKRDRKKRSIKECLLEQERRETTELVTRQSKEMLKLMEKKRIELMAKQGINATSIEPPLPQPPTRKKRDFYPNADALSYVDDVAIEIAENEQTSYTELVDQLTEKFITDLEKARAIFRWITVKDLNMMEFNEDIKIDSPMYLLRGIKYGTETYHTLFMRLCSYAGLHCVNVKGHSKSFGYEPGLEIQPGQFLNTWNAVLIDTEWRFVQCNWGARHLVMCKDSIHCNGDEIEVKDRHKAQSITRIPAIGSDKIEYEYDEHYFLTDPEEFIFEFFPFDKAWQMLEQPLNLKQFESLPFVRSLFFHYLLAFRNQRTAVIHSDDRGACDIQLKMPDHLKRQLVFHSQLRIILSTHDNVSTFSGGGCKDNQRKEMFNATVSQTSFDATVGIKKREYDRIGDIKLENFVLHTVENDVVSFNIHLPKRGVYYLELFANTVRKDVSIFGQTFKLRCVCKYKLICDMLRQRMHALPQCANGEWGPEKALRHYNWTPLSHPCSIIETVYTDLYVIFKLPKKLKVYCKLNSGNSSALSKCSPVYAHVNHRLDLLLLSLGKDQVFGTDDNSILTIIVQLPDSAQYGLDVYAFDPDDKSEKRVMSHCCKYLLNKSESFPHVLIGPNCSNTISEVFMPISHTKPDFDVSFDRCELKMFFMVSQMYEMEFSFKYEGDTNVHGLPLDEHLVVNRVDSNATIKLFLPHNARYILTIFLRQSTTKDSRQRLSSGDELFPVYGYAIRRRGKR